LEYQEVKTRISCLRGGGPQKLDNVLSYKSDRKRGGSDDG
jgi:hypothetical protein